MEKQGKAKKIPIVKFVEEGAKEGEFEAMIEPRPIKQKPAKKKDVPEKIKKVEMQESKGDEKIEELKR